MLINNKTATGLVLALALGISSAQAAMVNFTITGDVMFGEELFDNAFNLYAGDTITLSGTFDDSVLAGGTGTVIFDSNNLSNSFVISLGAFSLQASDDVDYALGGPSISFNAGSLTDVDFLANDYSFSSFNLGFDDTWDMYGQWRSQVEMAPVPVPAAVWLFGSGLIGLAAALRKKQ